MYKGDNEIEVYFYIQGETYAQKIISIDSKLKKKIEEEKKKESEKVKKPKGKKKNEEEEEEEKEEEESRVIEYMDYFPMVSSST